MIKKVVENLITAVVAMIGIVGGLLWAVKSGWDYEPTILVSVSSIEILSFIILKSVNEDNVVESAQAPVIGNSEKNINKQNVNVSLSLIHPHSPLDTSDTKLSTAHGELSREEKIELMKSRVQILFIDDDKKFKIVQNLKDGGWKLTKTVSDIKNVDVPIVSKSQIIFVDINGVGLILNLQYEGLDLALMLKQKYPEKKVIIYSANKHSNSFHGAWDVCDYRLEKNALPYQFQSLVESYSIDLYKKAI